MQTKTTTKTLIILSALLLPSCALNRNSEPRTASDLFFDTTDAIFGMLETNEFDEDLKRNRDAAEKRQEWQCENLNDLELRELGINK